MPLVVECPSCGRKLKVPDELAGKQVRCADCAGTFVAEKPRPAAPPTPAPQQLVPARTRDEDNDDDRGDRPSRRKRRSDFEAHRGGMILAMGIISIVVGGIGLVTGIIAWKMGGADLKKIDAGRMDPEGRSMTQIGYILGIIGTILNAIGLVFVCLYFVVVFLFLGLFIGAAASMPTTKYGPTFPPPVPPKAPKKSIQLQPIRLQDYLPHRLA